jgi:endonuclease/exonuclease/phosphatase family metal-dependent hydrolase
VYARSGKQILKVDKTILSAQMCSFKIDDVTLNLVYRSPNAAAESIVELADAISDAGANEVFLGDFNMPGIDWVGGSSRGREALFAEAVEGALMQQMVDFPTQVKGNTLDLVITNIPERIEEIYDAGRLGKSDHVMVVTKISVGGGRRRRPPPARTGGGRIGRQ